MYLYYYNLDFSTHSKKDPIVWNNSWGWIWQLLSTEKYSFVKRNFSWICKALAFSRCDALVNCKINSLLRPWRFNDSPWYRQSPSKSEYATSSESFSVFHSKEASSTCHCSQWTFPALITEASSLLRFKTSESFSSHTRTIYFKTVVRLSNALTWSSCFKDSNVSPAVIFALLLSPAVLRRLPICRMIPSNLRSLTDSSNSSNARWTAFPSGEVKTF